MNLCQWILRSTCIVLIMWNGVYSEMTCDVGSNLPEPCQPSPLFGGRSVAQACRDYGCCYATDPQTTYSRCYKKMISNERRPLDVRWQTTRAPYGPNPWFGEQLLHGGETGFQGNQLVKNCHLLFRRDRCFQPWVKVNKEKCERSGCCWSYSGCYKPKLHITYLRKRCPPGFKNPPRCEDKNECADLPCEGNGKCINKINDFSCECFSPYSGRTCTEACGSPPEIENGKGPEFEPLDSNGPPYAVGTQAMYECNEGYERYPADGILSCQGKMWSPLSIKCRDIIECDSSPCHPNALCTNTDGSFECDCNDGYTGNGFNCADLNECDSSPCDPNAECTNTEGSFECDCNGGYTGNGVDCEDLNECDSSPCDPNAECTNIEGSFECDCNGGYTGNGVDCEDINECDSSPCDPNAECTNTEGSFQCDCNDYFFGNGFDCEDIVDCSEVTGDMIITQGPNNGFVCSNGWTVFQSRIDGRIPDFHLKTWEEYSAGFGSLNGEFWLGLRTLHLITKDNSCRLRVDLESFDGDTAYAEYSQFSVGDITDMFRLGVGGYSGTAGNSFILPSGNSIDIDGQQFSTNDRDNDRRSNLNCVEAFSAGGWWANGCFFATPNGRYRASPSIPNDLGIFWHGWKVFDKLKSTQLGVRCD